MSLFSYNLWGIGAYLLALTLKNVLPGRFTSYFFSVVVIFIIFGLGSLNIVSIIQAITIRRFTRAEFLSMAAPVSLVVIPSIDSITSSIIGHEFNFACLSILFFALSYAVGKLYRPQNGNYGNPAIEAGTLKRKEILSFISIAFTYSLVILIIIRTYYALPDLDPYYWLSKAIDCAGNFSTACFSERSLYQVFNYLFIGTAKIDPYGYFKYLHPFIILFVIPIVYLVGKKEKNISKKIIYYFLPLASSSTLLYLLTPMPQVIAIVLTIYFVYWLIYSWQTKNIFFYYVAGFISLSIFWYQEIGFIFFTVWLLVTAFKRRKNILVFIRENRIATLFAGLMILSYLNILTRPLGFFTYLLKNFPLVIRTNFLFPAYYINVDGNSMGWGKFDGVVKYYLYYAGPLFLLLVIWAFTHLVKSVFKDVKSGRNIFLKAINIFLKLPEQKIILGILFSIFFLISEIVPRLFNYAFLPERVWIYGGIVGISTLLIFKKEFFTGKITVILTLFVLLLSVMGGIYVNHQKKFFLPNYRLNVGIWMNDNLPKDAIIFSAGDHNVIKHYAKRRYYILPESMYCDTGIRGSDDLWDYFDKGVVPYVPAREDVEEKFINQLISLTKQKDTNFASVVDFINKFQTKFNVTGEPLTKEDIWKRGYVYFYKEDPNNPYTKRPYYKKPLNCNPLAMDKNDEGFTLIYNDREMVKIWKIAEQK